MAEFGASATLEVEVDQASLREARAEVEDGVGGVSVGAGGGAGGSALADGSGGLADLAAERNDILDDILDELQQGGGGGGGGGGLLALGGGDGGGGGGGGGFLGGLLGGRLAGSLGGLGGLGGIAAAGAPVAGAAGLAGLGATVPAALREDVQPGAQSLAASFLATPPGALLAASTSVSDGLGGPAETGGPGPRGPAGTIDAPDLTIPKPDWLDILSREGGDARLETLAEEQTSVRDTPTLTESFTPRNQAPEGGDARLATIAQAGARNQIDRQGGDAALNRAAERQDSSGDTSINITPEIAVEQEGLSVREAERKIEAAMDEAKQEAVSEVERRLSSPIPRGP